MTREGMLVLLLAVRPALAIPAGDVDSHSRPATDFVGDFSRTLRLSLGEYPAYGVRFLDAVQVHVHSVCAMRNPPALSGYLEEAATRGMRMGKLQERLGRESLPPPQAAALMVAAALYAPAQIDQVIDAMETLQIGLGHHAAEILRSASERGDQRIAVALRLAGSGNSSNLKKNAEFDDGRWNAIFDSRPAAGAGRSEPSVFDFDKPPSRGLRPQQP